MLPPSGETVASTAPSTELQRDALIKTTITPIEPAPLSPPPPPRSAPPRKRHRGRNFLLFLLTLLGVTYGGGTYYSLVNDNFHDFFTEYIPGGEDAVLYFEERAFKRRFPSNATNASGEKLYPQTSGEKKVAIPAQSGMQARVQQPNSTDLASKGRHISAVDDKPEAPGQPSSTKPNLMPSTKASEEREKVKQAAGKQTKAEPTRAKVVPAAEKPQGKKDASSVDGRSNTPNTSVKTSTERAAVPIALAPPIAYIDSLKIDNAADPIVQEMTKIVNDVIAVVNADNASGKYATTFIKAKDDLARLASDVSTVRATEATTAEKKIRESQVQFDNGAKELVRRIEEQMKEQELHWREEYEAERERIVHTYQEKLKAENEAAQKLADQRLRNALLEQERISNEGFATSVRERVESERSGRLSKLENLSHTVTELEKLISKSNDVVDANLRTQHLVVAVDAVRHVIETADRPRPFVHELAALKEIADDNPVVAAAVASINPLDYQRGLATPSQLIDRFRSVAGEVRKAALLPGNAGVASHAASLALSKVTFRKQGLAVGNDVDSVLARTETLLEEGDLDGATREMNGLTGWAKILSRDWLGECRRVLEVRQALDVSMEVEDAQRFC